MFEIRKRPTLVDGLIVLKDAMEMAVHTSNHLLGYPHLADCHKDIKEHRDNLLSKIRKIDKRIAKFVNTKTLLIKCDECQDVIVDYKLTDEEFEIAAKEDHIIRDGNHLVRWDICWLCNLKYKDFKW